MAANTHVYIQKTGTDNKKKGTYSLWLKRSLIGSQQYIIGNLNDTNNYGYIRFKADDILQVLSFYSSSTNASLKTNRKFRDTNAWYHIVVRIDMAQSTESDRMRLYVNGVEETSYSAQSASSDVNNGLLINSASTGHRIASQDTVSGERFDGLISHVHYCDGYSYGPEEFGETDSTTGQWKIKTSPSVTYGSTGYFMFKDNASLNDQSGNSNNFTAGAGGAPTPTVDNPSNNFATMNPLHRGTTGFTNVVFKHGATTVDNNESGSGVYPVTFSSLAMSSGKFYCEMKVDSMSSNSVTIGIEEGRSDTQYGGKLSTGICYKPGDGLVRKNDSDVNPFGATYTNGDIIGVALDLDNNYVYFSKNGTWQNSGDPTSGSSGTGGIAVVAPSSTESGVYHFSVADNSSSGTFQVFMNFGNGYFGSTAISSEGTNASGIGKFEYNVPTGYTALCTKGLNE